MNQDLAPKHAGLGKSLPLQGARCAGYRTLPFVLYLVTIFVSATLLFLVEPIIGKMLLPLWGGTPAVWNTCLVFFQAMLLAGYLYAYATSTWHRIRHQMILHVGLLLLPIFLLPFGVDPGWRP